MSNIMKHNQNSPSFDYDSASVIPWSDFEDILDAKWFSEDIVGAQVTDTNEHNWRIIKAGEDYYDLWYEESIGNNVFYSLCNSEQYCYWLNSQLRKNLNSLLFYDNTDRLPTDMKDRVIDKEVNAAWFKWKDGKYKVGGTNKSIDKVWLLTATEIGGKTVSSEINNFSDYAGSCISALNSSGNDGEEYAYFLDDINKRKSTGNSGRVRGNYNYFWLATGEWISNNTVARAFILFPNGSFDCGIVDGARATVPAVRVA